MSTNALFIILLEFVAFSFILILFFINRSQQAEVVRQYEDEVQKTKESSRKTAQNYDATVRALQHRLQSTVAELDDQFRGDLSKLNHEFLEKYNTSAETNQAKLLEELRKNRDEWFEWGKIHQERMNENSVNQFKTWKSTELETQKKMLFEAAEKSARTAFEEWKSQYESTIQQEAIARNHSNIIGEALEHIVPCMPEFPYNPRDSRFIGSPIHIIIFDGYDEGAVRQVVFLEVKVGNSILSQHQKSIKDAILSNRIVWQELEV